MPNKCLRPGCKYDAWGGGYCRYDQYLRPKEEKRPPKDRGLFVREAPTAEDPEKDALNAWFKAREQEMTGICANCGGKSCKGSEKYVRYSICHILPKAIFKSVATHPDNWIELCFFGKSCHTNMDNKILELWEMACWATIIERFIRIYPRIAKAEIKWIPDCLLQYVEK